MSSLMSIFYCWDNFWMTQLSLTLTFLEASRETISSPGLSHPCFLSPFAWPSLCGCRYWLYLPPWLECKHFKGTWVFVTTPHPLQSQGNWWGGLWVTETQYYWAHWVLLLRSAQWEDFRFRRRGIEVPNIPSPRGKWTTFPKVTWQISNRAG